MSKRRFSVCCLGFAFFGVGWGRLAVYWYPLEFVFAKELTFAIGGTLLLLLAVLWHRIFREKEESQ